MYKFIVVIFSILCAAAVASAGHAGHGLVINHVPHGYGYHGHYPYPPHSPHGTSYRYDIRHHPVKYGYGAPLGPHGHGYGVPHFVPAYAPVGYTIPHYGPAHGHPVVGRHYPLYPHHH